MVEEPGQRHRRAGRDTGRPRPRGLGPGPIEGDPRREQVAVAGGTPLLLLVLVSNREDTTAVDLASGAVVRLRVPWPSATTRTWRPSTWWRPPSLGTPSVTTSPSRRRPPRPTCPARSARCGGARSAACSNGWRHPRTDRCWGSPAPPPRTGSSGATRPSVALIVPTRGPQLFRRPDERVHLGAVRLGPRRRLAAGGGPARRSGPGRGPPGPPVGKATRDGVGVQAPVPAGVPHPTAGRPLLQGLHRRAPRGLTP